MQKFFEPSIESDFIKSLLYYTPTPIFEPVEIGDYVLAGQSYLYDSMLIRCRKTGYLDLHKIDPKYVSVSSGDCVSRYKPFFQTEYGRYVVSDGNSVENLFRFVSYEDSSETYRVSFVSPSNVGITSFSATLYPPVNFTISDIKCDWEAPIKDIGQNTISVSIGNDDDKMCGELFSFNLIRNSSSEEQTPKNFYAYVSAKDGANIIDMPGGLDRIDIFESEEETHDGQIIGDFNDDGEVTDADAIYLLYHTFYPDTYPIYQDGDMNGDGEVTDADAIYLLYHTFYPETYPLPKGDPGTKKLESVQFRFYIHQTDIAQEAEYDILTYYNFGDYDQKATPIFNNSSSYYDSKTHKALGNYLRAYRSSTGIDLMPFYNCYGCETVRNVYFRPDTKTQKWVLTQEGLYNKASEQYVVYSVPIHFNKRYLIHIENMAGTTLKSVIYDEEGGFVTDTDTQEFVSIVESNGGTDPLHVGGTRFEDPIEYQVFLQDQPYPSYAYGFRTNLRLFIQVPKGKESTLVVTETDGVYTPMYSSEGVSIQVNAEDIEGCPSPIQNNVMFSQPELTKINTGSQYAFSDTLIQYLLLNAIDKEDRIEGNVERVQEALYGAVGEKESGQFSDSLRAALFNKYMLSGMTKYDINGFVDKSVENYLRKKTAYKGW